MLHAMIVSAYYSLLMSPILVGAMASKSVEVPTEPPSSAFEISPSFPNIALEFASLINYATTSPSDSSPNEFTINLLNEIFKRTGGQPIIRTGGTSGDYYNYLPDQVEPVIPIPEDGKGQLDFNTTIGPNFWPLTKLLAETNAVWIPQVSLANDDLEQVKLQAQTAIAGIGWDRVQSIEIGNEANYFPLGGESRPGFADTLDNNAQVSMKYAEAIAGAIDLPYQNIFLAGDIGYNAANPNDNPLNIPGIFEAGLNTNNIIKEVAGHYYQISQNDIPAVMNHSASVSQIAHQKVWRDYLAPLGIPYYLDESSVYTGPPPNNVTFRSSLGAALWRTDFLFYAMSIGIERVHWESVFSSGQAIFQPQPSGNNSIETRSGWYSLVVAADFIGKSHSGCKVKVAQIPVDGTIDNVHFTAYAAYADDSIARLAFVNLNYWDGSTERQKTTLNLGGLGDARSATVKYFQSMNGASAPSDQITYGGSQWPYSNMGLELEGVVNDTVTVNVENGRVSIVVPDSAAAVVHLSC